MSLPRREPIVRSSIMMIVGLILASAVSLAAEPSSSQQSSGVDLARLLTSGGAKTVPHYHPRGLGATRGGDVTVTLVPYNPPITIPASGGNFQYTISVTNNEATDLTVHVWTMARLPSGYLYGPVLGPVAVRLPGGWTASGNLSQYVPGTAPGGIYDYIAVAGVFPNEVWDHDSFPFEKLSNGGWYSQSPATSQELRGLSFPDAQNGWAVSDYREIIHTSDGGDTWNHQDDQQPYPQRYNDVCFVDAQKGWVVGYGWSLGGTILHTSDGGENWTEQDSYYDMELNSVHFVDADHGWAVGGFVDIFGSNHRRIIEHTSDGGATWSGQYWDSYEKPFNSVCFTDTVNGWAVGATGAIVRTSDGGATWTEEQSGTSQDLKSVFFADPLTGWCVGGSGTILHTSDGGATWASQNPGTNDDFEGVHFVDTQTGWAVGVDYSPYQGVMLRTIDGGNTWHTQEIPEGEYHLYDVFFIDADQGWAAGGFFYPFSGLMLHTESGGE